jgi:peptidoglycan/LPS O-acetylase OafA/YrhL
MIDSRGANNIPELDGWRGLAIIMVLMSHFVGGTYFNWMGSFGVQLFFVLSGFFMSNLLFVKKIPLGRFFIRRFSRVYPTFFFSVLIFYLYSMYQKKAYFVPMDELFATLTFLRTYYPNDVSIWSENWPIGHLWSLNVEEHSYIYLATIAFFTRPFQNSAMLPLLLVVSTFFTLVFMYYYSNLDYTEGSHWSLYSQCASFGLLSSATYNLLLARYFPYEFRSIQLISIIFFALALIFTIPFGIFSSPTLAVLFLAISINHLKAAPLWFKSILSFIPIRYFGYWSFSIYIWQQPFFLLATEKNFYLPILAIACGITSYYLIENPLRNRINSKWAS